MKLTVLLSREEMGKGNLNTCLFRAHEKSVRTMMRVRCRVNHVIFLQIFQFLLSISVLLTGQPD